MKRVLVVEDEASIREMVALNLRMNGMEAVEAESAEAALEALVRPAAPGGDLADQWRNFWAYNGDPQMGGDGR